MKRKLISQKLMLFIAIFILIGGGIWIYNSVKETNKFIDCMEIQGLKKCAEIDLSSSANHFDTDITPEKMLENLENYKIHCFDINSPLTDYEKVLTFTKEDVLRCSGKMSVYQSGE